MDLGVHNKHNNKVCPNSCRLPDSGEGRERGYLWVVFTE